MKINKIYRKRGMKEQLDAVLGDNGADSIKMGMLSSAEVCLQ